MYIRIDYTMVHCQKQTRSLNFQREMFCRVSYISGNLRSTFRYRLPRKSRALYSYSIIFSKDILQFFYCAFLDIGMIYSPICTQIIHHGQEPKFCGSICFKQISLNYIKITRRTTNAR